MVELSFLELLQLRGEFLNAFEGSSGDSLPELKNIGEHVNNAFIVAILTDMYEVFKNTEQFKDPKFLTPSGHVISPGTLFTLLFSENPKGENFTPKIYMRIQSYIKLANAKPLVVARRNQIVFEGAHIINEDFKKDKQNNGISVKPINFYTSKSENNIQWRGVIDGLDVKRPILIEVKKAVNQSFIRRNSKVCAVVLGQSGSGKSTLLRRLALDCIFNSNFIVLWVYNISDFKGELKKIKNNNKKYLVIFESWDAIPKTEKAYFLSYLENSENVRVVIGDCRLSPDYEAFIYGRNIFPLSSDDNHTILKGVLKHTPEWQDLDIAIFENAAILKAPLFIILFVLARIYSEKFGKEKLDTDDFVSQFNKIVKADLATLYNSYPSLPRAIFYWACLYKEYQFILPWKVFLRLADFYNDSDEVSRNLAVIDEIDPVFKLLLNYIYFEPLYLPFYEDDYVFFPHHGALVEALSEPFLNNWYYSEKIKKTIIEIFTVNKDGSSALDLLFCSQLIKTGSGKFDHSHKIVRENHSFSWYFNLNNHIKRLLDSFADLGEPELIDDIYFVILLFSVPPADDDKFVYGVVSKIVDRLIKLGCNSNFLRELNYLKENDMRDFFLNFIWKEHYRTEDMVAYRYKS